MMPCACVFIVVGEGKLECALPVGKVLRAFLILVCYGLVIACAFRVYAEKEKLQHKLV